MSHRKRVLGRCLARILANSYARLSVRACVLACRHELYVRMYRPVHSTWFGQFRAWLLDSPPEFDDPHLTPHGRIGDGE